MAYEHSLLNEKIQKCSTNAANRAQRDLPETEREKQMRMNPQVLDITDHPPIFATTIANMTT